MESIKVLNLDFRGISNIIQTLKAVQYDDGRAVRVMLSGTEGNISKVRIYCQKPSGMETYTDGTVVNDYCVLFGLTPQMLAEEGIVKSQLQLMDGEHVVTSFDFQIQVSKNRIASSSITSSNEYQALVEALKNVDKTETDISQNRSEISKIKGRVDTAEQNIDVHTAQIAEMQKIPEGGTTADAALNDIKIGYDGTTYQTPGEAVRGQVGSLSEEIEQNKGNFDKRIKDINTVLSDSGLFSVDDVINMLDETKIKNGFTSISGDYYDYEGYVYTDFIPVDGLEKITLQATYSSNNSRNIMEVRVATKYDKNKNPLSEQGQENIISIAIESNVSFVVLTYQFSTHFKEYSVYATDVIQSYKEFNTTIYYYKRPIIDLSDCSFAELDNYFNKDDENNIIGKYVYQGNLYDNSDYYTSDFIKIAPGETYSFNKDARFIECYDVNKNYITGTTNQDVRKYTTSNDAYFLRFTGYIVNKEKMTMVKGETPIDNAEYGYYISERYIKKENDFDNALCFMPDEIVCAVGRTIEIYNSQVCPTADKYHFRWICQIGKALKRKFSVSGLENLVGDYDLTLSIYDDDLNTIFSKTAKLKIVNKLSVEKTICPIGDSLTNNKYWLKEVRTLSDNKISFVGTRGTVEGIKHEGRSGFTAKNYLTETEYTFEHEGVHPFWNQETKSFDWGYYKTTTGINPDAVQIFLGTNDLIGSKTPDVFANNIKTMVDNIRENDSSIPIILVMTLLTGNQNGLGIQQSSDGFASQPGRFKYDCDLNIINGVKAMYDLINNGSYTNIFFIPLTQCHDSEYNFGAVETPVNPRAVQTELMPNEGIHPQQQGYEQFADVMYAVYSYAFSVSA